MSNYVVKDDNPDVGFKLTVGEVKDSEGNVITDPQGLETEILSTNDGVVQFTPGANDREGSVRFGSPGQANLNYNVKDAAGNVLGSGSDGFTVTTGDPASITGITANFDGLTPTAEAPAPATSESSTATSESSPAAPETASTDGAPAAEGTSTEGTGTEG